MDGENTTQETQSQVQVQNSTSSADNTQLMSILAYIGILVLIPFLTAKENPSVRFHVKQGLVLCIIEIVIWFVGGSFWILMPILGIINLALVVLSIIGIVNVVQKKEVELPLIGSLAKHINI